MTTTRATRAVGYARVSTAEQGEHGLSLDAQAGAIAARVAAEGWELVDVVREVGSGRSIDKRPHLSALIARLEAGEADTLVVAHLDRLTRSTIDAGHLFERVRAGRWSLVALDLGIDTRTSAGELVANVMVSVGQWQRRVIGERTREGLAEARRQGTRLGRPPIPGHDATRERIRTLRATRASWQVIADRLNEDGVPTIAGSPAWTRHTARAAGR